MRFHLVGRTIHDVDAAPVTLPARNSRRKRLIVIRDAAVMFFLVLVLFGVGRGVAALPEGFNKVLAFFVVRELFEGCSFLVGDDPDYVFVQPLLVRLAELDVQRSLLLFLLFFGGRALEGIDLIRGLRQRAGHSCVGLWIARGSGFVALGPGSTRQACGDSQERER